MFQSKLNTMQKELEVSVNRADEEAENVEKLQIQLTKFTSELAQTKSKYEKVFSEKTEEFDELKRRLNNRINELTESYELERGRVVSLERTKNQLSHQCQEMQSQLDNCVGNAQSKLQTIKSLESQKTELEAVLEEALVEESNLRTKCGLLQRDLIQIRATKSEMEERVTVLEKENKQNSEKLKETKERLSVVNRQVTDLESSRARLEAERDNLDTTLRDTEDALHECEARYQTTFSALSTLRNEFERQSRDKEEELESLRRSSQRNVENLKAAITDMEMKNQNELDRLKKKLEGNINNLQVQLEEEKNAHLETIKVHEETEAHICQLEMNITELNNLVSETANTLQICESRRSALANEVEGLRCQFGKSQKNWKRKLEEESCGKYVKVRWPELYSNNLT
uniref:SJCHGC09440 protein n=1 Tax=Schistosoma japonicum TaxID=6182 RepID=Q5DCT5_SCHJA|nr:SJCHGC09440 protein [Schistosoma japonicum]